MNQQACRRMTTAAGAAGRASLPPNTPYEPSHPEDAPFFTDDEGGID